MKWKEITNQINHLPIDVDIYKQSVVTKLFDIKSWRNSMSDTLTNVMEAYI